MGRQRLRGSGEWTGAACFRLTAVPATTPPYLTDSERPAFPQHRRCPSPGADRCGERASDLQCHSVMWPHFSPDQCTAWQESASSISTGEKCSSTTVRRVSPSTRALDGWVAVSSTPIAASASSTADMPCFASAPVGEPCRNSLSKPLSQNLYSTYVVTDGKSCRI